MKKIISLLMMATLFAFTACDVETDEEPGGTATEKAAGFWTVHAYYSVAEYSGTNPGDESNMESWEWDDFFGESGTIETYNTAANVATEMWFEDSSFFGSMCKVDLDYKNLTFTSAMKENQLKYGGEIQIIKGKVTLNGTTSLSGAPADHIVVYAKITNNDNTYGLNYIKYEGFRYTGFSDDID